MYYIYVLMDPINCAPFYIGKGCGGRMNVHLKEKYNERSRKSRYIKTIRELGHEPYAMKVINNIENEREAYNIESVLIELYHKIYPDYKLTNRIGIDLFPPSRKGVKWKKEWIEKRSNTIIKSGSRKGRKISEEQKIKISNKLKGREPSHKVFVDVELLRKLYIEENMTKKQVMKNLDIGGGSLNRILKENRIYKSKI
jgi:hypothetical protein